MHEPGPEDDREDLFTGRTLIPFCVGLALYGLGFLLLAKNYSDVAPAFIVAGILAMVWAFL